MMSLWDFGRMLWVTPMTKEMNQLLNANGTATCVSSKGGFYNYYNGTTKSAYLLRVLEIKGKRVPWSCRPSLLSSMVAEILGSTYGQE